MNPLGILINCLFYADDAAVIAESERDLQALLDTCDSWAKEFGIDFAPTKCAVTSSEHIRVKLAKQPIVCVDEFPYLGIQMNAGGIMWDKTFLGRIRKASQMVGFLYSCGMNEDHSKTVTHLLSKRSHIFVIDFCNFKIQLGFHMTCRPRIKLASATITLLSLHLCTHIFTVGDRLFCWQVQLSNYWCQLER